MKVRYKALMAAAQVLQLQADTMRRAEARADMLYEVAEALLVVANNAGIIEFDDTPLSQEEAIEAHERAHARMQWNIAADYAVNNVLQEGCWRLENAGQPDERWVHVPNKD